MTAAMAKDSIETKTSVSRHSKGDLMLLALYEVGGADGWVDVEDVYLRAFDIAPKYFSWRTRSDLPNYEICRLALRSIEKPEGEYHELIAKRGKASNYRRLTRKGLLWCRANEDLFTKIKSKSASKPNTPTGPRVDHRTDVKRMNRIRSSSQFSSQPWKLEGELTCEFWELSEVFMCLPSSSKSVWEHRLDSYAVSADRNNDDEALQFIEAVRSLVNKKFGC